MIDKIFVNRKITFIKRDLNRLKEYQKLTFKKAAQDWKNYCIIKNLLMEIIGRAIDINQHLISELAGADVLAPLDYTQTFLKLVELGVLPKKFSQEIAKSAGFRNAIVHGYNDLDREIIYHSVKEALNQYLRYCQFILGFLSRNPPVDGIKTKRNKD